MSLHRPSFEEFSGWVGKAPCVPVYRQLTGDGLTPVSAFSGSSGPPRRSSSRA